MYLSKFRALFVLMGCLLCLVGCEPATPSTTEEPTPEPATSATELIFTVSEVVDSSGTFTAMENHDGEAVLRSTTTDQWLSFNLDVQVAGRYKVEALASPMEGDQGTIWVEDYIDNPDDRTYNITGNLYITADGGSVDGSPLNVGTHPMKVHFKESGIALRGLKFTLLREHQETPIKLTQNMEGEEWDLIWSDEFDGTGLPDTSKWTYDIGDWGWGNNELQYYTENRLENARQEDGNLIIEARKDDDGYNWSSARLTTRGKVTFTYGKIEFRAKVPVERGNWAAGWTLGDNYVDEISWPYCGEIDILETVGYEIDDETGDGKAHASIHCGAYYFKLNNHPTSIIEVENMHDEWHTYGIIWTPEGIEAYVDDQIYFTYNDTSTDLSWPYSDPQNLILNLAMGGGWGGAEGMDETVTNQQFVIDYVRVYGRK
jgi:beta-glucanase (GH16 family)